MNVHWIFAPVTQLVILGGILAIGLIATLGVWLSVTTAAQASKDTFEAFRISTERTIKELNARIDEMRAVPAPDPVPSAAMGVQGLNLTNRTKALRMHRRGESIASIAGALGVQQEEIDLLLKVDRLLEAPVA